jgi:hypothetical protein
VEAPLARDDAGNPFELPDEAAYWRVRRQTTGRPRTVLGPDGEPLYVPILAGAAALEDNGCGPDRYRLEAADGDRKAIPGVPVAVLELAGAVEAAPARGELVPAFLEPPRSSTEALTRTLEAMQRTQLERERQNAERERWQMQAMVESQRSVALICTSLIERLKPAPSTVADPLSILKQQAEANKMIEQLVERRTAIALPAAAESTGDEPGGWTSFLSAALAPIAPAVNQLIQAQTYKMMGLAPEQIAAQFTGVRNDAATAEDEFHYPRCIRQVLGELTDNEANQVEEVFAGLSDAERNALFAEAEKIVALGERTEWTRRLLQRRNAAAAPAPPDAPSIPPAFQQLFAGLSSGEQATLLRMLARLDLGTLEKLATALLALDPATQLEKVRGMIQSFEQRETATAQRTVFSTLQGEAP